MAILPVFSNSYRKEQETQQTGVKKLKTIYFKFQNVIKWTDNLKQYYDGIPQKDNKLKGCVLNQKYK